MSITGISLPYGLFWLLALASEMIPCNSFSFHHVSWARSPSTTTSTLIRYCSSEPRRIGAPTTPLPLESTTSLSAIVLFSSSSADIESQRRQRRRISLKESGREVTLLSRPLEITPDWTITVWEWENPSEIVESYWEAQQRQNGNLLFQDSTDTNDKKLLDPFGLVTWPGSVVAAREMQKHQNSAVANKICLILGAGVGVEAQAAAMLGATRIIATDIHPTTLQQLELGIQENSNIITQEEMSNIHHVAIQTNILDVFDDRHVLPECDLLVVADVLYNEQLAKQVCTRIVQACQKQRQLKVLVTDSQRFVDFPTLLSPQLDAAKIDIGSHGDDGGLLDVEWKEESFEFTGSGVCIDEDQTYDVKVRVLWINK